MRVRRYWWIALGPLAAALGLAGVWVARRDPADSFAGTSTSGAIAYLAGGWSLVAAGIVFSTRHRGNQFGLLITAAGFAWLLPGLADPGVESSFGFTIGLVALVACVPVVSHAALAYPTGRLRSVSNALGGRGFLRRCAPSARAPPGGSVRPAGDGLPRLSHEPRPRSRGRRSLPNVQPVWAPHRHRVDRRLRRPARVATRPLPAGWHRSCSPSSCRPSPTSGSWPGISSTRSRAGSSATTRSIGASGATRPGRSSPSPSASRGVW